ncbi:hypothetical protein YWIDRAFT_08186 [Streptomyces sp. SceaMP-e96]|nr:MULTISPECIES: hypothetical protein [unclassified Streptomyces]SCK56926.1 hypothetical protein YWIDRAFT_08186 [Streptomyces sp. SceaMP-e96]
MPLEQQPIDLDLKPQEWGDDLASARAANRELMTQLNLLDSVRS